MEIFANWIFWVSLAAIIFLFALIGYLSDSKRKRKENEKENFKFNDVHSEDLTQEKLVDNSGVTTMPDSGATLNLDNGTWNNNSDSGVSETIAVDGFNNTALTSNTEEVTDLGEQPASDLFGELPTQEVVTPTESYDFSQTINNSSENTLEGTSETNDSTNLFSNQSSEELNVFDQPVSENLEKQDIENNSSEVSSEIIDETPVQENNESINNETLVQNNTEADENNSSEVSSETLDVPAEEGTVSTEKSDVDNTEVWKF